MFTCVKGNMIDKDGAILTFLLFFVNFVDGCALFVFYLDLKLAVKNKGCICDCL